MIIQCLVPPIMKNVIYYSLVLGQQPLQIQIFNQSISIYLKTIRNVFSSKNFM